MQERGASTLLSLGVVEDLLEWLKRDPSFLRIGFFVDKAALFDSITGAVKQEALGGKTVAPRASRLLILALDIFM